MARFEVVSRFKDKNINLPTRKTKYSAGYDFEVAENIIVPSSKELLNQLHLSKDVFSLEEMAAITKGTKTKPTLVPTGIKCYLDPGTYLQLSVRSSCPLKYWLILANGVGIIDGDYADNPDNEGEIFFQIINLSPVPIILHKGDVIGQGVILNYNLADDDAANAARVGGFGSTDLDAEIERIFNEVLNSPEGTQTQE